MFIIKRTSFISLTFYIKQLFNGVQSISIRLIYFLFGCIPPRLIVLTMVLNIHRRNCLVCHERYTSLDWFIFNTNRRYQTSESSKTSRIGSFQNPNCNPFQSYLVLPIRGCLCICCVIETLGQCFKQLFIQLCSICLLGPSQSLNQAWFRGTTQTKNDRSRRLFQRQCTSVRKLRKPQYCKVYLYTSFNINNNYDNEIFMVI